MNITESFNEALRSVITFLPKLVAFLVILLIGWLVAKGLRKLVDVVLTRLNFNHAVERGGLHRALERSRYTASSFVAAIVFYAILLIALQIAFGVFGSNPVSDMLAAIVAWLPRAIVAIVIVVVAAAIASGVKDLLRGALGGLSYGNVLATVVQAFIIGLGVIAALNQIGVATTVTTPVLITVLATMGAILAIGVGGGLMRPMQQRWERWLNRAEDEVPQAKAQAEAYQRGKEDVSRAQTEPIETPDEQTRTAQPPS